MKQILVVDDEKNMRKIIKDYLERENYLVDTATNGEEALEKLREKNDYNLVILDVMMPKLDGWSVLRIIKEKYNVPVMLLTARSEDYDELFGLELGADEYIKKPFSPKVLVARIQLILKRGILSKENREKFGAILLDEKAHKVYLNGQELDLTSTEFKLLVYFTKNHCLALSRNQIMENVWGYQYFEEARTVDTYIKRLRKKLNDASKYIVTIRGVGYRFEVTDE